MQRRSIPRRPRRLARDVTRKRKRSFYLSDDDDDDDARGEWRSIKRARMDVRRKKHALECVRERDIIYKQL